MPVFDVNQRQSSYNDQWVGILMLCSSKIQDRKQSSLKETGYLDTKTLPVLDVNQRQSSYKDQWVGILMLCSSKIQDRKQSSLKEKDICTMTLCTSSMLIKDKLIKDQWVGILILCPSSMLIKDKVRSKSMGWNSNALLV